MHASQRRPEDQNTDSSAEECSEQTMLKIVLSVAKRSDQIWWAAGCPRTISAQLAVIWRIRSAVFGDGCVLSGERTVPFDLTLFQTAGHILNVTNTYRNCGAGIWWPLLHFARMLV